MFPEQYFRFCFAYGSGVFKQFGVVTSKPMLDMIFAVDDSVGFHGQNMHMNPHHYSGISRFGHRFVAAVQEKVPARIYFNTMIPIPQENIVLKYGVTTIADLINDLLDWNYLYLAGRLHKPVETLVMPTGKPLLSALKSNLLSALHAAFLILPEFFTERQLYVTIANLSYNGDFRMVFGEDKNKVRNIVDAQVEAFRAMYAPYLLGFDNYIEIPSDGPVDQTCMQDMSSSTRLFHLFQNWFKVAGRREHDTEEIMKSVSHYPYIPELLTRSLRTIVFDSSVKQSLKGILTAGIVKSVRYSNEKITKMINAARAENET
ncbi:hypothetical protein AAG570_010286 [Ranatra chinensis]|uniref:Phosphatidate cytidylyltransferase, mitochondrial n=1 Tax=Ranatra chinensis TaxID=642074 RepID=A0ABD0YM47_9HEMI